MLIGRFPGGRPECFTTHLRLTSRTKGCVGRLKGRARRNLWLEAAVGLPVTTHHSQPPLPSPSPSPVPSLSVYVCVCVSSVHVLLPIWPSCFLFCGSGSTKYARRSTACLYARTLTLEHSCFWQFSQYAVLFLPNYVHLLLAWHRSTVLGAATAPVGGRRGGQTKPDYDTLGKKSPEKRFRITLSRYCGYFSPCSSCRMELSWGG